MPPGELIDVLLCRPAPLNREFLSFYCAFVMISFLFEAQFKQHWRSHVQVIIYTLTGCHSRQEHLFTAFQSRFWILWHWYVQCILKHPLGVESVNWNREWLSWGHWKVGINNWAIVCRSYQPWVPPPWPSASLSHHMHHGGRHAAAGT